MMKAESRDTASAGGMLWSLSAREASILAAILIACVAVYLPSGRNGWVFDDTSQIVKSYPLHSWTGLGKSFLYDSWWFSNPEHLPQSAYYRPLQAAWFGLNYMMLGNHPAAWHLEKILLQLIGVMLCFRLAQLLTRSATIGLVAAAVFALLPANVESVAWASAIGEPLATIFEMGAMCCFIGRKRGARFSRGMIFALLLYGGAILSHETAILFGAIVAAYVLLFEGETEATARRVAAAVRAGLPFALVAMGYMGARLNALGWHFLFGVHQVNDSAVVRGFVEARPHHSAAQILMTLPLVAVVYLAVLAIPGMADPTHALEWITHPQAKLLLAAAALLLAATAAWLAARRNRYSKVFLFCAVWSAITIAPALNLNALWWLVDDRYLYAPSFGWSLAVAIAVVEIAASGAAARKAVGVAMAVFLAACAIATMRTERYWYDDVAFFQRCVELVPNDAGYRIKLAAAMNQAGNREGAAQVLERGTELDPDQAQLRLRLAQQYQAMGRELDFEREFQKFNELSSAMTRQERAAQSSDQAQPADAP